MEKFVGAKYQKENRTCYFSVWAPGAEKVSVEVQDPVKLSVPLQPDDWGFWEAEVRDLPVGTLYKYSIDGKDPLPDPASRFQPDGPHGPSAVVAADYAWATPDWKGIPKEKLIIYELHTGTFSPSGTFEGILDKLDYLADLGINAIEIMPVAQFPGNRNWGYDGVDLYAIQNSYGGPNGFRNLIDACHQRGIAVILDVVYNHLGPEGNYLSQYGPYFTDKYNTPWGQAINFDDAWSDGVRNYFLQNALMWLRDYRVDGLRLDAVHAIRDLGPKHFLQELSEAVDQLKAESGREHFLIAEVDLNDTRFISPREKGGYAMDAQWVDEFHHALHSWLTGETNGYYEDFGRFEHLVNAYKNTYVYNGIFSPHRKKRFGTKADQHPYHQFVVFAQNHDQTGNRMLGERLSQLVSFDALKLSAAAYLLSPYIPMIFMGEEWGETAPFNYFVSHTDKDLVKAVRKGRKKEFADFHGKGEPSDPQSEETFQASKLNWGFRQNPSQLALWELYRALINIRKNNRAYQSSSRDSLQVLTASDKHCLGLLKTGGGHSMLSLLNFSSVPITIPMIGLGDRRFSLLLNTDDLSWDGKGMQVPGDLLEEQEITLPPLSAIVYEEASNYQ